YAFTENKTVEKQIIDQLSFGGGCINDTIYHLATPYLPFGGVGGSGMGSYHGRTSFETFSHQKSILKQTTVFDLPMRYPTMKNGLKIIRKLLK
ncbi:MAG TPA: aldehyde dehydrogenase family protein, partial [Pseudogracilibacillus sp.]|nr:aldehyde dehydrogenase family protein [Pseudogracilibacillus sp.]